MPSARSLAALNTPPGPRGLCGQRCGRWRAPRALTRVRRGFAPLTSMLGSDARHPTGPHHAAPTLSTVLASPPGPPLFSAAPPPAATAAARRPPPPPPPPPSSGIYGTPPDGTPPDGGTPTDPPARLLADTLALRRGDDGAPAAGWAGVLRRLGRRRLFARADMPLGRARCTMGARRESARTAGCPSAPRRARRAAPAAPLPWLARVWLRPLSRWRVAAARRRRRRRGCGKEGYPHATGCTVSELSLSVSALSLN